MGRCCGGAEVPRLWNSFCTMHRAYT